MLKRKNIDEFSIHLTNKAFGEYIFHCPITKGDKYFEKFHMFKIKFKVS